ncbi:MAG: molybdopterin-dependent oxidoreductase [Thermoanaerobaculia bacterium]|nr:molybdopterin-dependent oxidoreductase [Thermoanaerobaculia bacterium]
MAVETVRTVCNRDCPDACGLIATVEDGKLVALGGDAEHPVTKGFLCQRTSQYPATQNSPDRLTTPLLRRNGRLEPASWEEALGFVAERLLAIRKESGPAAILHYRSGGSLGLLKTVVDYFWELFGPVAVKSGDICSGAGDAAQTTDFGDEESHDFFDLLNAKNILLWGKNPAVSNVHLMPVLQQAKKQGARVILVDPIHHKAARLADRTILVRPGGDFDLAMGAAARLFETGGADPDAAGFCDDFAAFRALATSRSAADWARAAEVGLEDVHAIAAALRERPCSIQVGWGMGRRMNGSAIVRALDALGAVSGNLGIPGGGVSFYYKRRGPFDTSFLKKTPPRTIPEPLLGAGILAAEAPPIRAVWVTAGNPVSMLPDSATVARALETRELVVVVDTFLTDTARRATVVFPTTTLVEDDDLLGAYGNHFIGVSVPVVRPPAGVKSDLEVIQALARAIDERSGERENLFRGTREEKISLKVGGTAREWKRRLLSRVEAAGVTLEHLERSSVRNPFAEKVLFGDRRFPTPSGKMSLVHTMPPVPPEEPGFPLWLFSNSTEKSQSSQWAAPEPDVLTATCHPAAANGFRDGDAVRLESAIGSIRVKLKHDPAQRRDVVIVPKGGNYDRGNCANALIRARLTDAGEGAAYQDCRVRLVPA